jgi:lipopolysaccharide biosynthesis glycosyltransferase
MKKKLIVTIMFGKDPSYYFAKKSFEEYAKKVNADFICLEKATHIFQSTNNNNNHNHNHNSLNALFEKLSLGGLARGYEYILYIDADVLITPHAENIFDLCKDKSSIFMFNEGVDSDRSTELNLISRCLEKPINDRNYFNAGIILFPSKIDFLTAIKVYELEFFLQNSGWFDQTYVNFKVRLKNLNIINLDRKFNFMKKSDHEKRFLASFIHYAGNGYCSKKQRPIFMLNDYCYLYNYSLTTKEKVNFYTQYVFQRLTRLKNKLKFF